MARRLGYKVVQLREGLIGGTLSDSTLEKVLDGEAADGGSSRPVTVERPVG